MMNKQVSEKFNARDWGTLQNWLLQSSVRLFITTATHNAKKEVYFSH